MSTQDPDDPLPPDFDFDAEFAKAFGTDPGEDDAGERSGGTRPRAIVATVLTPIASAPAVAGLLSMAKVEATVVPTPQGAAAVRVIERNEDDDSLAELLGEAPEAANALARTLSRSTKHGAILLVARLGDGDEGLVGSIAASRWLAGERTDEPVAAGLILAQADDAIEDIMLGRIAPKEARGAIEPGTLPPWQARRLFRKTQRKPRP